MAEQIVDRSTSRGVELENFVSATVRRLVASEARGDGRHSAPAGLFLVLTVLEGQIVTPMLLGHRLEVSPVVICMSVLILGWMWGLVGALMAVPIVTSARILCSNVPSLRAVGRLLAR